MPKSTLGDSHDLRLGQAEGRGMATTTLERREGIARPPVDVAGEAFGEWLATKVDRTPLKVFLCGARITRGECAYERPEARLRYEIMGRLERSGCTVMLGEDTGLYKAAQKALRARISHADHEFFLASGFAELTIVFPCSAGSFAELGMFAVSERIAQRLLVIIDDRAEYKEGYIAKGPARMAQNNQAVVEFAAYEDIEGIWALIAGALDNARLKKLKRENER